MSSTPRTRTRDPITVWLLTVAALVALMIVVGGFVRLSRAGLSIVEWDVVSGVVPPIGEAAWQEAFSAYQQTPEFRLVNRTMDLDGFRRIFLIEWGHRLLARLAGLVVVAPLVWFLVRGTLTLRTSLPFWGIAVAFGAQGALGWIMVASGLRDVPAVSATRLMTHLLLALGLLSVVLWMALDRIDRARAGPHDRALPPTLAWAFLSVVGVQVALGALVAGLRAGVVSNTWPLMDGRLVPAGLGRIAPWWRTALEPLGAHFLHRWFAIAVVVLGVVVWWRSRGAGARTAIAGRAVLGLVTVQLALGITVVLLGVPRWAALTHQAVGVAIVAAAVVLAHDAWAASRPSTAGSSRWPATTGVSR